LKSVVDKYEAEHGSLAVEKLDGESENYDRIRATVESIPFLSLRKLVVLSNSGVNKDLLERYEDLLGAVADSTDLLIVDRKLDKRTGYYKYLKKHTDYKEFSDLSEQELVKWLVERAKNQGASISQEAARYLQERVGSNQILLANELDKLVSYDSNITKESIDLLCEPTPSTTIFSLLEAAFSGDKHRTVQIYQEQRLLKVEPLQIIAMVAWQLHVLMVVALAKNVDDMTVAREAKLSPYVVRKTRVLANRFTVSEIKRMIESILKIDIDIKTKSIDSDSALQLWLLTNGAN
ncbi:DNA polymerase III subunit delta, partial [Candidatus Saccharibacteria bacterium]|nr:DNA polymerase III subunit delta [Candidatus Saccharibacteria bacterium]